MVDFNVNFSGLQRHIDVNRGNKTNEILRMLTTEFVDPHPGWPGDTETRMSTICHFREQLELS